MSPTVIVFGPTGNVGSVVAPTAHSHGAKVILAMRDTSKSIPGLSKEDEKKGNYERVQADMSDTESIKTAVKKTGATRAFIYLLHGNKDGMKSCLEALKSAGIEFVVFLSSYTLARFSEDPKDIPSNELIPYIHAQVEMSLDEVYGRKNYVALRPGAFATTLLYFKDDIKKGERRLYEGDYTMDWVAAEDMGGVGGTILATQTGPKDGQGRVYIYGATFYSFKDALELVAKKLGKPFNIIKIDREEAYQQKMAQHVPESFANYLLDLQGKPNDPAKHFPHHQEGLDNVQKYLGRKAMSLPEWVDTHRAEFD